MNENQVGSTVKIETADSVKCVVCGEQVYAMKTPYICHKCWKHGTVGEYIAQLLGLLESARAKISILVPAATGGLPADGDELYDAILAELAKPQS